MKRYRVIATEFETRILNLQPPAAQLPEAERALQQQSYGRTLAMLKAEYGEFGFEAKLANLRLLNPKPMSVVEFHNHCLNQCRQAFVCGQYYPALASAYLLAERMLAHLIDGLQLIDDLAGRKDLQTENASTVAGQESAIKRQTWEVMQAWEQGRDWHVALEILLAWQAITPTAAELWRSLYTSSRERLHVDEEELLYKRELAFTAINQVEAIIREQFAGSGSLPWLLAVNDEVYIRKEFEQHPFIQLVYLPSSVHLGYQHQVRRIFPWEFHDNEYPEQDVSDEEFMRLRASFCEQPSAHARVMHNSSQTLQQTAFGL